MKKLLSFGLMIMALCLQGCSTLQPTSYRQFSDDDVRNYRFFYVMPTGDKSGSSGGTYLYYGYGVGYASTAAKSINPGDLICGYLMGEGMVRAENVNNLPGNTVLISYGETGVRRPAGLGYTIEVMIQFINAETHDVICTVTGEGIGDTEADDVRIAVTRCLDTIFHPERITNKGTN